MKKPIYFKQLDALRFIAFFLVFWHHGFQSVFADLFTSHFAQRVVFALTTTGGVGVHVFFVISGFLITYLMIREKESTGKVSVPFFYVRRILRIWPLYYFVMIIGIWVLPLVSNTFLFRGSIPLNLTFLNNFDHTPNISTNVGVGWSVAIEEQFYLFWPLIFVLAANYRRLLWVSLSLYLISVTYVIIYKYDAYEASLGNLLYLMTGCMGAILYSQKDEFAALFRNKSVLWVTVVSAISLLILKEVYSPLYYPALILLPACYLYWIIYAVDQGSDNGPVSNLFAYLGKYTYGMYLFHPILITGTKIAFDKLSLNYTQNKGVAVATGIVALLLTIVVAILSYELVEKRILTLKERFAFIKTRI
jgi:peptidoglycan/LPS O-acetylase OafA/YrhL